jgi:hypothetical protein
MLRYLLADEEELIRDIAKSNGWKAAPDEKTFFCVLYDIMNHSDAAYKSLMQSFIDKFKSFDYAILSQFINDIILSD